MKKICWICFLFLAICCLTGCKAANYDVYLFRYDKYFTIFPSKKQSFIEANRFFHKSHNNVKYIKIQKFSDLQREYEVVKTRAKNNIGNKNTVFFLDNLCFNAFMATSNHPDKTNFKFITYNYEEIRKDKYQRYSTINFVIDFDLIYNTILDQIKEFSTKEDYSDVAYLYGANFSVTSKIADKLRKEYPTLHVSNVTGTQSLKNWINKNNNKYNVFVVFAMEYNQGLMNFEQTTVAGKKIVEVFSNFGSQYDYISRSVLIDEVNTVQHCLHSKYVKQYLSKAEDDKPAEQTKSKSQTKSDTQSQKKSQQKGKQQQAKKQSKTTATTVKKQAKTTTTTVKKQKKTETAKAHSTKEQTKKEKTPKNDKTNEEQSKTKESPQKQEIEILSKGVTNIPLANKNCLTVIVHKQQKENYSIKLEQKILENNKKKEEQKKQGIEEKNFFQKALDFVKKILPQKTQKNSNKKTKDK